MEPINVYHSTCFSGFPKFQPSLPKKCTGRPILEPSSIINGGKMNVNLHCERGPWGPATSCQKGNCWYKPDTLDVSWACRCFLLCPCPHDFVLLCVASLFQTVDLCFYPCHDHWVSFHHLLPSLLDVPSWPLPWQVQLWLHRWQVQLLLPKVYSNHAIESQNNEVTHHQTKQLHSSRYYINVNNVCH